ncbi:TPA: peptidylprolyl isomerase [Candidatus Micrarchaeota archaeon]|nr:peptidylprolyl isomerase [Candidatus Micrarchaeota archaeon]HIH30219.1 peptidylprolyl isomerase [Candidatus Micrarchaeota archaeon]
MVSVKKGDLVRIEYTGRVAASGQVFDTTDESLAMQTGIFEKGSTYGPKLAVFGHKAIMSGMEEAIASCPLGKSEEFMISPVKAFGEKLPQLIRMVPEKEFAKQNLQPVPGMIITLDGIAAKVKSVTSGRVVVDFNHPLAGESVLYSLKVHEVISDPKKKIEAILASLGIAASIAQAGSNSLVSFKNTDPQEKIEAAKRAISVAVPGTEFKAP